MEQKRLWWLCFYSKWDEVREYLQRRKKKSTIILLASIRCCFHTVCANNAPIDIIESMIHIVGKDIVFEMDYEMQTPLHDICASDGKANLDTINLLVDVGGDELLMIQDRHGRTALHNSCQCIDNKEVIQLLIRRGGRQLAQIIDKDGMEATTLQDCSRNDIIGNALIISDYIDLASCHATNIDDDSSIAKQIINTKPSLEDLNNIIDVGTGVPSNHFEMFIKYRDEKLKHEIFLHSIDWVLNSRGITKEQRRLYADYQEKLLRRGDGKGLQLRPRKRRKVLCSVD